MRMNVTTEDRCKTRLSVCAQRYLFPLLLPPLPPPFPPPFPAPPAEHGEGKAASVEALCWFLTWGSLGGNTLNAVLFEGRRGAFEIAFAVY